MDRNDRQPTEDEIALWLNVMRDAVAYKRRPSVTRTPAPVEPTVVVAPLKRPYRPVKAPTQTLKPLEPGRAVDVDRRTVERMRQGERTIEAALDLHGLTREGAHAALSHFLFSSVEAGRRCVLVVTGKGGRNAPGVLRSEVPRWLNTEPLRGLILAYAPARPKHGGEGALYVLLKRRR